MLIKFLEIVVISLGIMWISGIIYLISKGKIFNYFYHHIMGWHLPNDEPEKFDGCNFHAYCKFCGKEIMQDSQGNWFTFKTDEVENDKYNTEIEPQEGEDT